MKLDDEVLGMLLDISDESDKDMCCFDHTPEGLGVLADFLEETGHARHADVRELFDVECRVPPMAPDGRPRPLACGGWFYITAHPGPFDGYELTLDVYAETVQGQAVAATIPPAVGFSSAFHLDDVPRRFERIRRPSGSGVAGPHHGRAGGRTELPGARLALVLAGRYRWTTPPDRPTLLPFHTSKRHSKSCRHQDQRGHDVVVDLLGNDQPDHHEAPTGPVIGVLGDVMLDVYLRGTATRLTPEAAVPVVNHMASMVGPMAGHSVRGMSAGRDMANGMGMISLGRGEPMGRELGPSLGRGLGEQTSDERARRNGEAPRREKGPRYAVPGYPQDMMDMHGMHSEADMKKLNGPLTRGMRRDWFAGVEALHTIVRVPPPDLYDRVVSGKGEVKPGESVPGVGGGEMHHHHPG
jgi:hypothetical protein